MLTWIKTAVGNAHLTIIAVLILAIVVLSVGLKFSTDATALAQANYNTVVEGNKTLQGNVDKLTLTVKQQEQHKKELQQRLDDYAKVTADYEQQATIQRTRAQQLLDTIEQLRNSQNEQTKTWATAVVPDVVKRLRQLAVYCANRDHRSTDACKYPQGTDTSTLRPTSLQL